MGPFARKSGTVADGRCVHRARIRAIACAALLLSLAPSPEGAVAQTQAVQSAPNAHRFLEMTLPGGGSFPLFDNVTGEMRDWADITQYSGDGCRSTIHGRMPDGRQTYRVIDWTRTTSVEETHVNTWTPVVLINGDFRLPDGAALTDVAISLEDTSLLYRLRAAAEFLRSACDRLGATGF